MLGPEDPPTIVSKNRPLTLEHVKHLGGIALVMIPTDLINEHNDDVVICAYEYDPALNKLSTSADNIRAYSSIALANQGIKIYHFPGEKEKMDQPLVALFKRDIPNFNPIGWIENVPNDFYQSDLFPSEM